MLSALFGLIALTEIALLGLALRLRRLHLLVLVLLALVYDNVVIAIGGTLGEGQALRALSYPRYATHALLVPLLILIAVSLVRARGLRLPAWPFGVLTAALIALGLWADIVTLDLEPTRYADTLRYTNAAANGPPIPAVVTILVLIGLGAVLLFRVRWPWLLAGSATMFAAAAAGAVAFWIGNIGELVLIGSVVLTAYWVITQTRTGAATSATTVQPKRR
ncbi:hypothetical protein AB0M02_14215 [Actinoplanes sp. NPDC051861]|uniref:hypothetical protein n=1 Tax=Actinoplanes sp. NPDC051861 TaxID=3155170 RepID=UPI0034373A19